MEKQDVIQRSTSPGGGPCLLVCKPNNKGYRFVVDYRGINKLKELEATPLPTTEVALSSIGSSRPVYFTTLDLQSGFFQVTIDPDSRPYTAFRSHLGLHEFNGSRWDCVIALRHSNALWRPSCMDSHGSSV